MTWDLALMERANEMQNNLINGLEIWILEDDEEYLKALGCAMRDQGAVVNEFSFVGPLHSALVDKVNYPDVFIIDLLNPPSYLRGKNRVTIRILRFFKNMLGPIYYWVYFRRGVERFKKVLEDPQKLKNLNVKDPLCWPWGGLQLLALLADPYFLDIQTKNRKVPRIMVNTIMDTSAERVWNLGGVADLITGQLIPRIDELLYKKFTGQSAEIAADAEAKSAVNPKTKTLKYLTYVVKGGADEKNGDGKKAQGELDYEARKQNVLAVINELRKVFQAKYFEGSEKVKG